jgi:hypothetical protein
MRDNINTVVTAFKKWYKIPSHLEWNDNKLSFVGDGARELNSKFQDFRYAWDVCITTYDMERVKLYKQAWYDNIKVGDAVYWNDPMKNDELDIDESGVYEVIEVYEKQKTSYLKIQNDVGLVLETKKKYVKIVDPSD